jgi:hypothetical protein
MTAARTLFATASALAAVALILPATAAAGGICLERSSPSVKLSDQG